MDQVAHIDRRGGFFGGLALASTALALVLSSPAFAERVGIAGAVNPGVFAVPAAGGERRALIAGQDVQFRERIVTDAGGQTQILFLDRSAVTVGPSAELVIDEFVYNPQSRNGSLGINVASGAVRFVGGALSKQGGVTVRTPVATIGIRGGVATTAHNPQTNVTTVTAGFGVVTASFNTPGGGQGAPVVVRPGFSVSVSGGPAAPGGSNITPPTRATPTALGSTLQAFEGNAGQGGGGGAGQGGGGPNPSINSQAVNQAIANNINPSGPGAAGSVGTSGGAPRVVTPPPVQPVVPVVAITTPVVIPTTVPPPNQLNQPVVVRPVTPTVPVVPPVVIVTPPVVVPPTTVPPVNLPPVVIPPVIIPPVTLPPPVVVVPPASPPASPPVGMISVPTAPMIPTPPNVPTRP